VGLKGRIERLERETPPARDAEVRCTVYLPLKDDGCSRPLGRYLSEDGTVLTIVFTTNAAGEYVTADERGNVVPM
jgi:hypothetical protein